MREIEHVINVLEKARKAAYENNSFELKELSNQTIHSASIYQDADNVLVAVIVYSLSKIIEKGKRYYKENYSKYLKYYLQKFEKLIQSLKKNNLNEFRNEIRKITDSREFKGDLKQHIKDMFQKARINKAGRVYEHGLSMETTARLLGISLWELSEYSGQSGVSEMRQSRTIPVSERIKTAMEIFEWFKK